MNILPRSLWFLALTCFALAFVACRVNDLVEDEPKFTAAPEYTVDLFEQRDTADGAPTFGLWVERIELSDCEGYGVDATVSVQNGRIEVKVLGVIKPAICLGDSARARQFLAIGQLADGTYEFSLSLRDVIQNKGTLTVAGGHYTLSLPDAKGVVVENFILEPLPDGIVWGYAATPDEPSEPVADNFLTDLKTLTAENDLTPGFYSYFTISGTGNIEFHKSIAPAGVTRQFVRRLTAAPDALKGLLQNYRDATQQPLQIKCWTTEGEW
ncbi:MAG TPA: hypothetical protein PK228_17775 [Saprospiraceae bacterium]|nr:hypothetical protein [Saprospiraceae bacterium]